MKLSSPNIRKKISILHFEFELSGNQGIRSDVVGKMTFFKDF